MHIHIASIDVHCIKSWDAKSFSKIHIKTNFMWATSFFRRFEVWKWCSLLQYYYGNNEAQQAVDRVTRKLVAITEYAKGVQRRNRSISMQSKFGFTDLKLRLTWKIGQNSIRFLLSISCTLGEIQVIEYSMYHTRHHESVLWWRWNCAFKRHVIHLTLRQRWSINNADMVLWMILSGQLQILSLFSGFASAQVIFCSYLS